MSDVTYADEPALKKTWIYAIGVDSSPTGPVKIGRTTLDVERRLHAIRGDNGLIVPDNLDREALKVLYAAEAEPWVERRLHIHFHRYRLCGEWFGLNPAVVAREVKMAIAEMLREAERMRRDVQEPQPLIIPVQAQALPDLVLDPDPEPIAGADAVPMQVTSAVRDWELFNGWLDAGFAEEQALRMVAMLVSENR